jgi:hypothetical protein
MLVEKGAKQNAHQLCSLKLGQQLKASRGGCSSLAFLALLPITSILGLGQLDTRYLLPCT